MEKLLMVWVTEKQQGDNTGIICRRHERFKDGCRSDPAPLPRTEDLFKTSQAGLRRFKGWHSSFIPGVVVAASSDMSCGLSKLFPRR
ncbi:hypothetical protein AVEN_40690-1 [Araneus ventricosus]|uniref:Uncharacterized protein n=1 Tax=Araneus ventricosus TaxID=182803 RepID=A0A4Y2U893_ARAVE|nr:hypothetical protein AVEN_40690-1 [Araneus ventricosus]